MVRFLGCVDVGPWAFLSVREFQQSALPGLDCGGMQRGESIPELRPEIRLDESASGTPFLVDGATHFRFEIGEIEAQILRHVGKDIAAIAQAIHGELGDDYDLDQVQGAIADFFDSLAELGLLLPERPRAELVQLQFDARRHARATEQLEELGSVVERAVKNVPFHRDHWKKAGIAPPDIGDLSDLKKIPPMAKSDIRRNFPDGLLPEGLDLATLVSEGKITVGATSGTASERLQVLFDFSAGRFPERAVEIFNLPDDKHLFTGAVLTSPICAGFECHLGMSTMEERTRGDTLTLNSSDDILSITDDEIKAITGELHQFAPHLIFINPWYGAAYLRGVERLGLKVPSLTAIFASYQYPTARHRKILEEGFSTPVYSYYGATDLGGSLIGMECHQGRMHAREDHVFLELDGDPDLPDGLGHVTVTTLQNEYMPLIRYRVGDVARWDDSPCTCVMGTEWPTFTLEGRLSDALTATDGRLITTRMVDNAVGPDDLDFYQVLQHSDDHFELVAIPAEGRDAEGVKNRLLDLLGADAKITISVVDHISPTRSLKFRQTGRLDR
jgi:phenylacetate-CoA ligase